MKISGILGLRLVENLVMSNVGVEFTTAVVMKVQSILLMLGVCD